MVGPHPDTITRRFKKLAAAAGLPTIDWKALSKRIGHANVAFTLKQYVQKDLKANSQVATTFAELIIGGSLVSREIGTGQGAA